MKRLALLFVMALPTAAGAQQGYLLPDPSYRMLIAPPGYPVMRVHTYSWTSPVRLEEIKRGDIITIRVDEKTQMGAQLQFDRNRRGQFNSSLDEFVRLNQRGNLDNAAANSPTIDAQLQSRMQSGGSLTGREFITYNIAAVVRYVFPNGQLLLEARKRIAINGEVWEYKVSGVVRAADVSPTNQIFSQDIAFLDISRQQKGKVRDSTRRRWGARIMDFLWPF